jgi:hypothetical protein
MADEQEGGWETVTDPTEIQKVLGKNGANKVLGLTAGGPGSGGGKAASEGERKAAFLATRLAGSLAQINSVANRAAKGKTGEAAVEARADAVKPGLATIFGGTSNWFGNMLTGSDRQRVENAQLDILDAALTLGTGAAYTKEQLEGYRRSYFPQINDSDEAIADKKARLDLALEAAKVGAGTAAPQIDAALKAAGYPVPEKKEGGGPVSGAAGAAGDGSATPPPSPPGGPGPDEEVKFNDELPAVRAGATRLTPQQEAYISGVAQRGGSPEEIINAHELFGMSLDPERAAAIAKAYENPANRDKPLPFDYSKNEEIKPVAVEGEGALAAGVRGVADVVTAGALPRIGAAVESVFGEGTYDENLDRNRGIILNDEQQYRSARTAGQLAAGFLIPSGAAGAARAAGIAALRSGVTRGAAEIAAARAFATRTAAEASAYGGAYGFNSADGDLTERLAAGATNAAVSGVTGGALALGGSRVAQTLRARAAAAPAVAPRAAATAYQEGQDLGINLPLGATGSRGAAIVDQTLSNMPGSAGVMQKGGEEVRQQVTSAVRKVASNYGSAGGTFYSIGEAAQRGAKTWMDRFSRVSTAAYNAIPISPNAPTILNNSVAVLDGVLSRFSSNPKLASIFKNGELEGYRDALKESTSWQDLKDFRSVIGEKIGEFRFGDGAAKSDLRALYAGLSDDMRSSAAAQGSRALTAFERANNLYAAGQNRIEGALTRLLGDDGKMTPEAAGAFIDRVAQGNKGSADINTLLEVEKSLPAKEWGEVAGSLISIMGQPANSQGREFAAETFTRRFGDMSDDAREALFGNGPARQELEKFVRVSSGLARAASVRNSSNTAGQVLTGLTFFSLGNLPGLLAQVGSSYAGARLMTNPKFVAWATGYTKMMRAAVNTGNAPKSSAINSQLSYLGRIARAEPAIANDVFALQQRVADAFGGAPTRLAADERNNEPPVANRQDGQSAAGNQGLQP